MTMGDESCSQEVLDHVESADLTSSESSDLSSWIAENSELECQVHCVGLVAQRLDAMSDLQVVGDFCGSVATYARFLEPEAKGHIEGAYLRVRDDSSISTNYFTGLRYSQIDIREHVKDRVPEDWTFTHPRRDAATWHYHLYLASLEESESYDLLEKKLEETQNGNDATNLIKSLGDLKTERTQSILEKYRTDQRTADDPVGPGPKIADTVELLLSTFPE